VPVLLLLLLFLSIKVSGDKRASSEMKRTKKRLFFNFLISISQASSLMVLPAIIVCR